MIKDYLSPSRSSESDVSLSLCLLLFFFCFFLLFCCCLLFLFFLSLRFFLLCFFFFLLSWLDDRDELSDVEDVDVVDSELEFKLELELVEDDFERFGLKCEKELHTHMYIYASRLMLFTLSIIRLLDCRLYIHVYIRTKKI